MAMFELGPGRGQSMHRHPGEAWLYVLEGEGHSYLGTEPEGGTDHRWKKGDLIIVDHFLWHQHFNDHPDNTAKVVRIHMRSEEHTSELQSRQYLVCRLLLEK